jgi:plastocyanin
LTSPANLATNVSSFPNLVWAASSGATSYSVQLKKSTDASYTQVATVNAPTTNFTVATALTANTVYDWQVVASNAYGSTTAGPSHFTTTAVEVVNCSTVISAVTVTAEGTLKFNPDTVTIAANDVVRWISASTLAHTVTSGIVTGGTTTTATPDGKFDQPINTLGSSVCLKFTAAGTYNYYCTHHFMEGMTGIVTVTP